ncbi:MAG: Hsp20/alpha crystallin family protein [Phaeodactylibacter sp.]|nr:Hsp20/alpha crystallin family protein [Phaeodactylibacter sp.]MCB9273547.1 Hsp20/alpha crystallin family protein [Lewinellaceae bacterium]
MCKGSFAHHGRRHWHGHHGGHRFGAAFWQAPANVIEYDGHYELHLYAPERSREDFQLQLAGRVLTITAREPEQDIVSTGQWIRREYRPGSFERSFSLNDSIDTDGIKASYADGVLRITLPKYPDQVTQRRDLDIA